MKPICCIADLHILSNYGLALETFKGEEGVVYTASEGQLRLLSYWRHFCNVLKTDNRWRPSEIWLIGDVFAGTNPVETGRKVRGTFDEQLYAGVKLLKMLPKVAIKIWCGTPYHESWDTQMHQRLVENLRKEGREAHYKGNWSFESIGRTTAFVCHHASAAVVYPHTPAVRDARWFKIQYFDGKLPRVDWVVRADKHTSSFIDDRGIYIVQVPCWQAFVPYKKSLRAFPMWQPDIGAVFLWTDKEDRRNYQEWLYPPFLIADDGSIIELPYDAKRYVRVEQQ